MSGVGWWEYIVRGWVGSVLKSAQTYFYLLDHVLLLSSFLTAQLRTVSLYMHFSLFE